MEDSQRFAAQFAVTGASNVSRGLGSIVAAMSRASAGPFRAAIVAGLGRSYGLESSILARGLPSVLGCGAWSRIRAWRGELPSIPARALVADVGNDVAYGVPTATIAAWFEEGADRLQSLGFEVVTTGLPIESVSRLDRLRFAIVKGLLFPERALEHGDAIRRTVETDACIRDSAAARGIPCAAMPGDWYGLDPIHIRRRHQLAAWHSITAPWGEARAEPGARLNRWTLTLRPERWSWAGEPRHSPQPAMVLEDGSELWLS